MRRTALAISVLLAARAQATPFDDKPTLRAMKDELERSMQLQLPSFPKPYYVAYSMWDVRRVNTVASFGQLVDSDARPVRSLDIDLRVGDPTFDNSNTADKPRSRSLTLTRDDDYDAVRRDLWLATDEYYKQAVETLERKRAVAKAETKTDEDAGAFTKEQPSHIVDTAELASPDRAKVEALVKKVSAVFRANPDVHACTVTFNSMHGKHYFVSSEGSASLQPVGYIDLSIEIHSQADDGMPIHDTASWWVQTFDQLPSEAELVARAEALSKRLSAVRTAPVTTDYAGPVLFSDVAAAQLVRALLADDFSGTPPVKSDRPATRWFSESQLVGKVGQRILPATMTIVDDPTVTRVGKQLVIGGGRFDEEGMPAQKVTLVENGTFKGFLMSRIPRKGFDHSNGHAASSPYTSLRAHPANLIVSGKGLPESQLRKRAIALAKEQGLDHVLVVEKLAQSLDRDELDPAMFRGDATVPPPAIMRRIYTDGREQLVRGGAFGPIPLRTLRDIVAQGTSTTIYSYLDVGMPGRLAMMFNPPRHNGGFLVSIAAPSLLLRDVELKKPQGANKQPRIAPRPK
jgi:TldD protein